MTPFTLIITLLTGLSAGVFLGILLRKLIAERNAVSKSKYEQLTKESEQLRFDLRQAQVEQERLINELRNKENEIRDLAGKSHEATAEISRLKANTDHSFSLLNASEAKLEEASAKTEHQQQVIIELNKEKSEHEAQLKLFNTRNSELASEIQSIREAFSAKMNELSVAEQSLVSFREENKHLKEKLETQKQELEEIGQKFSKEFQLLAEEILEQKSKKFSEQNHANLKIILDPLGKNIDEFKRKVEETYDKESKERFSLSEKVKELSELNQKISQEAHNLTQALKGSVKQQGNWGEMLLESILQNSGLRRDYEYQVQTFIRDESGETMKDDEGRKLQPDVIVNLPDERQIIIDSKVSLIAYDRYVAAEDKQQQSIALADHVRSIKAHIDGLSSKNYQSHVKSLDFVMLFVPIEPAYMIAMQHDTALWEYAYKKRILLISPTNLIAALKLVSDLWQREQQNKNAMKIAERGAQLYEKFVSFVESLEDIGKKIDGAQKSYGQAMSQLSTGRGNLIRQVEMLNELGVKAQKSIPSHLLDDGDDDAEIKQIE
jgi:DNA recombination protein RmuC